MKILKALWDFIKGIIISVWALAAIFTTICLISYNKFNVTVLGKYTLFVVDNNDLQPIFFENDIVIIKKPAESEFQVGEKAFFYLDNPLDEVFINYGEISRIEVADHAEDTFYFGEDSVSYDHLIGKANGAAVYHKVGFLLKILESRWGFMFLIILPTLYAVVAEIYMIIDEAKKEESNEN